MSEIKSESITLVDIDSIIPNYFNIQLNSKNPIKLNYEYAEIYCSHKANGIWVKVDLDDLERLSKVKWKFQNNTENYIQVNASINSTTVILSRFLMSPDREQLMDHINGDPTDNRKINLRYCNHQENMQNRKSLVGRKYKGIYYDKARNQWVAQIRINGKGATIGRFLTDKMAAIAYNEAAKIHHGEFARLNNV